MISMNFIRKAENTEKLALEWFNEQATPEVTASDLIELAKEAKLFDDGIDFDLFCHLMKKYIGEK